MRRWFPVVAMLLAGCGRFAFDPSPTGDGGGDGGAGGDGTTGDGQATCGGPSTLFCDGFEDPALGAWAYQFGDVQHTTMRAHTGTGAVVATSDEVATGAGIGANIGPVIGGGLHARGWFYLPSGYALQKVNLLELVGTGPGTLALVDQGELNAYLANPPAQTIFSGITLPRDQWLCIELDVVVGDSGGIVVLSLDGTQVGSRVGVDTLPTGGAYNAVTVGMPFAGPGQPLGSVFVDDVKVMTQPVFCN